MKKFFIMGALALTAAVLSDHQASAWTNFKFGAGVNLGYQAGGNNFGWGLFRNGNPPEVCCPTQTAPTPPSYAPPAYTPPAYTPPAYPPQTYAQPSNEQGFQGGVTSPAANVPAQTQSYNRAWPTQTVNYQYPYSYAYSYYYGYRPYNYGYYR